MVGAPALAVYVHWPFCLSKCPYCDFNSHVRDSIDETRWRRAYGGEIAHFSTLAPGRRTGSVFFGGGTPSLMSPAIVEAAIAAIDRAWPLEASAEITLEANPTSVEARRFAGYRAAGVNRLSLGVQALDDGDLKRLGRAHSAAEALAALDLAKRVFPRVSFDLIYGRAGQEIAAWRQELLRALDLAGEHLSLYQLTLEPGTPFFAEAKRGGLRLPGEDELADLFEMTQAMTTAAGLPAYEISNHARPGAESRHNLAYWRYGDYVGIGPGAHGRLGGQAFRQRRSPESWLKSVGETGHATETVEALDAETRASEALMMGLRLKEGVEEARIAALAGKPFGEVVNRTALRDLVSDGFLRRENGFLGATPKGALVLNSLLGRLLA